MSEKARQNCPILLKQWNVDEEYAMFFRQSQLSYNISFNTGSNFKKQKKPVSAFK